MFKMAPFDGTRTISCSIVSEIKRDIGRKSQLFNTPP